MKTTENLRALYWHSFGWGCIVAAVYGTVQLLARWQEVAP